MGLEKKRGDPERASGQPKSIAICREAIYLAQAMAWRKPCATVSDTKPSYGFARFEPIPMAHRQRIRHAFENTRPPPFDPRHARALGARALTMGRQFMQWALVACALALGLVEFLALQRCRYQVWREGRLGHH
jgi:hypothetical protein